MAAPINSPARAFALSGQVGGRGPLGLDQVLGRGDEIGKRILFLHQFAVEVPGATVLGPAAYVRDRVDEPVVQKRQPRLRKIRIDRIPVRAVAVQVQGRVGAFA